jgi:hypothetical protein
MDSSFELIYLTRSLKAPETLVLGKVAAKHLPAITLMLIA